MAKGTVKKCSRQGTGPTQTRTVTITRTEPPPPGDVDYDADNDFYRDALLLKDKEVEYTVDESTTPPTITGLSTV